MGFLLDSLRSKDMAFDDLKAKTAQLLAVMPAIDSQLNATNSMLPMNSLNLTPSLGSNASLLVMDQSELANYAKNSQLNAG